MPYKDYNRKMAEYMLRRYHQRRKDALDYLGGACAVCGTQETLEIDHIDPEQKSFYISQLWSVSQERFTQELSKCQLLCNKHHVEKSRPELSAKAKARETAKRVRSSTGRASGF